jgi:hypothetical protein
VGNDDGKVLGVAEGDTLGRADGATDGTIEGVCVGRDGGTGVGTGAGTGVCTGVGIGEGTGVGIGVGTGVGIVVVTGEGTGVGTGVGTGAVGAGVGTEGVFTFVSNFPSVIDSGLTDTLSNTPVTIFASIAAREIASTRYPLVAPCFRGAVTSLVNSGAFDVSTLQSSTHGISEEILL